MSIWSWLKRPRLRLDEDDFQEEIRAHLAVPVHVHFAAFVRHLRVSFGAGYTPTASFEWNSE
jgi:hypothetical protein